MTDLKKLRALLADATPGPWECEPGYRIKHGCRCLSCVDPVTGILEVSSVKGDDLEAQRDARLIVALRNNAEAMFEALEAADEMDRQCSKSAWCEEVRTRYRAAREKVKP